MSGIIIGIVATCICACGCVFSPRVGIFEFRRTLRVLFYKRKNANYSKDFDYESILVREKVTRLLRLQVNRKLGELRLR